MIVLYGNWGSGKSSVIKYIHDELNKEDNFICIIFDAWLYEKE
jgi:predicted KAP-like P-loop ATPase